MPITSIRRDTPNNVSIVRISTTDTLSAVASVDYILNQEPEITALNGGAFQWFISDTLLISASNGNAFYEFTDPTFSTLILLGGVTSGTVLPGLANEVAIYAGTGNTLEGTNALPPQVQVATGSLNSGTNANAGTFFRGDGTWASVGGGPGGLSNGVYVSVDGNDSTGNGSLASPYKSLSHALTTITTATATNTFNVILLDGQYNDTGTISLKPYVNVFAYTQGTTINNTNPVVLNTAWNGTTVATVYLANISFIGNINIDFSGLTAVAPSVQMNSVYVQGSTSFNGNATGTPSVNVFLYAYSCLFTLFNLDNAFLSSFNNFYGNAFTAGGGTETNSTQLNSIADTFEGSISLHGTSSGSLLGTYNIRSSVLTAGLFVSGINATLSIDESSYVVPSVSGGPTISLVNLSNGVNANYTPSNYTPIATPPDLSVSLHAHLRGIDSALGTIIATTTNYIYVSNTGSDSTGKGTFNLPYATVAKAETSITTATANNPFMIYMLGGTIIETGAVTLKPFVNIAAASRGVIWQLGGNMLLDSSWATTSAGTIFFANFSYNTFDIILDFSGETNVSAHTIIFSNLNSLGRSISVYGSANTVPTSYCFNTLLFSYIVENSIAYLNDNILTGSFLMGTFNPVVATSTAYLMANRIGANVTLTGATSGGILSAIHFYSSRIAGTLTVNNANATLNIDAVSYKVPTVTGSATIVLTSLSNGLLANYTPVNYTPIAVAPDLTTSVHANLAGIDAALIGSSTAFTYVYVASSGGVDAVGNGAANKPYLTIAYALSQITTATAAKPYMVMCYGVFSETTINLKPFVYLQGNGSTLTVTNVVGLDSSWSTTTGGILYIDNFNNVTFTANLSLSFTNQAYVYISNMKLLTTQTWTITGAVVYNGTISNCTTYDPINIGTTYSLTNFQGILKGCTGKNITFAKNLSATSCLAECIGNFFYNGNITVSSTNSSGTMSLYCNSFFNTMTCTVSTNSTAGGLGCALIGTNFFGLTSILLNGLNAVITADQLYVVPTFSNNAGLGNVVYNNPIGTNTSGNAAAGHLGEYASSSILVGSAVSLTTATSANITSLSLSPGDWEIRGSVFFNPAGTTVTSQIQAGISTTTASLPTFGSENNAAILGTISTAGQANSLSSIGPTRISAAVTTSVFLVAQAAFTVSTMTGYGFISARRIR